MKVEFNGNSYNIGNRIGSSACNGCILNEDLNCQCPTDLEGECILSLDKIYPICVLIKYLNYEWKYNL